MNPRRFLLLRHKFVRVIESLSNRTGLPLRQCMDMFYRSETYVEMLEGISDMHCRADEYLAEELCMEYRIIKNS